MAAPLAASFVIWIAGILSVAFAYHRWKSAILRHRAASVVLALAAVAAGAVTVINLPNTSVVAQAPAHGPIGVAQGIFPGRVVWVHNPGATDWAGYSSSERWYDYDHTDPITVERMVSQAVRGLTGESSEEVAWDALFRHFNIAKNRGNRGYQSGEKIAIKINLTTCYQHYPTTYDKYPDTLNQVDTSPQIIRGVLRQLIDVVGVQESDISVGDPGRPFVNNLYAPLKAEFPNVQFFDPYGQFGRTKCYYSNVPFYWSVTEANGKQQDYLPTPFAEMDYFVNLAVLKGHSSGITLCGKNNYGSLIRNPDTAGYFDMHLSLPNPGWSPGMGYYRAIVDLMGHPMLGGKTLLYMVDGLYGGYYWEGRPYKWNMTPFDGDWPSSIFASQDPVAIDSVCHDFLKTEWPRVVSGGTGPAGSLQGGAEDYLHEAALAYSPPSGTFYDPDRDGIAMSSLGVHEHWSDPVNKLYSRNLGLDEGIELVRISYDQGSIARAKRRGISENVRVTGAVVTGAFGNFFYVEGDDRSSGIRVVGPNPAVGTRVNVEGLINTNEPNKERCIIASRIVSAGAGTITPVAMNGKAVGGGSYGEPGIGCGQVGIPGSVGLNNIGLLIRTSGRFRYINSSSFGITDGSGREITCYIRPGMLIQPNWSYLSVTGISSCNNVGGTLASALLLRSQSDIDVVE